MSRNRNIILLALFSLLIIPIWFLPNVDKLKQQDTSSGEALIGGAFTLTNMEEKTVSEASFKGKPMLVFFGFTHCPDICPITAATYGALLKNMGDKAGEFHPIFISVDPKRDTPKVIKEYLAQFDARIIGLTGSEEQIKQAASAYKAYYSAPDAHAHHAGGNAHHAKNYVVDHSGFIYLMDKNGKYITHFAYDASADAIAAELKKLL